MKKLLLAALAGAAVFSVAPVPVSAQGIYIGPPRPVYRERYVEPRYQRRYVPRRVLKCRPHFTVQDGVCKPYRGY